MARWPQGRGEAVDRPGAFALFHCLSQSVDSVSNSRHYLRGRLQKAGFLTDSCFARIMSTHEGKTNLAGCTQDRWVSVPAAASLILQSALPRRVSDPVPKLL